MEPRIEWDEITFLVSVFERMSADEKLPFLALWEMQAAVSVMWSRLSAAIPSFGTFAPAANSVLWRLKALADSALERLLSHSAALQEPVEARLVMRDRPSVALVELVIAVGGDANEVKLISAEAGSWIEIWQLGLAAFGAIHLTMATIDTTWEHSTSIYKRLQNAAKSLKRKSDTKPESLGASGKRDVAAVPDLTSVASAVELVVRNARSMSEIDPAAVARLDTAVRQLMVMSDKDLQALLAYAHPNLEHLELKPVRPPRTAPQKVAPRPRGRRRRAGAN
jgi:hypothetical protein